MANAVNVSVGQVRRKYSYLGFVLSSDALARWLTCARVDSTEQDSTVQ